MFSCVMSFGVLCYVMSYSLTVALKAGHSCSLLGLFVVAVPCILRLDDGVTGAWSTGSMLGKIPRTLFCKDKTFYIFLTMFICCSSCKT
jgi:hypothetical protein